MRHFVFASWHKKLNKKTSVGSDVDLENEDYGKWLEGEQSKEGVAERALNSLRGHREDAYVAFSPCAIVQADSLPGTWLF